MAIGRPIQNTGNVASKTIRVLATEGQTIFTVNGGYRINQLGVFRNGIRLSNNSDFTALDGVTVTLINPAVLNDELLFQVQDDFRVSDAIVSAASTQVIHGDLTIEGSLFGATLGIHSAGELVGVAKTLNFVGLGNTFLVDGDTVNISIAGGGGGGAIGLQSGGEPVAFGVTDLNIAIGSTLSRTITAVGDTATVNVDLGEYFIFRKPSVGFQTMRVLVAGSNGSIDTLDYLGGSTHVGMTTVNTDQFPWVAGIGITINPLGHLIFTVP